MGWRRVDHGESQRDDDNDFLARIAGLHNRILCRSGEGEGKESAGEESPSGQAAVRAWGYFENGAQTETPCRASYAHELLEFLGTGTRFKVETRTGNTGGGK